MYLKKQVTLMVCSAMVLFGAAAGENHTLTVENAVEYAVKGNISLKQNQISLDASKKAADYSWNSLVPSLSGSAGLTESLSSADDSNASVVSVGVTASMNLMPSLYTTIQNTKLSYEKSLMDYDSAVRSVEMQVRKIFYSLLYEQENIALLRNSVESAKNQYETIEAKYNRGAIAKLDVLNSQVSYQNSQASLKSAENTFKSDLDTFKQLLGIPLPDEITLSGSLDDILDMKDISIDGIEINSASVASIEKQIEIAENSLLATRFSAYGPSLNASARYSNSTSKVGSSDWSDFSSFPGGVTLSLTASIPLDGFFPWSSGSLSIDSQKGNIESLYLQLDNAKTTATMNVQKYLNQLQIEKETVALRKQSIEIAQQSYNLTMEAYNRGTKDLLALQNSADSLLQAQVNLKSEAYNMEVALLNLEDALGVAYGSLSAEKSE